MEKSVILIVCLASLAIGSRSSADLEDEAREDSLLEALSDTTRLTWEERWFLSEQLNMQSGRYHSQRTDRALFLNLKALESHNSNYDAYWYRIELLQGAKYLTLAERAAAIRATIDALLQGDQSDKSTQSDGLLEAERLRAHISGLDALYTLTEDLSYRKQARHLAQERLSNTQDCRSDWIFYDYLASTSKTAADSLKWYRQAQAECENHKLKEDFYAEMTRIGQRSPEYMPVDQVELVFQEWEEYLHALKIDEKYKKDLFMRLYIRRAEYDKWRGKSVEHSE